MSGVITTTTIRAWLQNIAHEINREKVALNVGESPCEVARRMEGLRKRCLEHETAVFNLGYGAIIPDDVPTGNSPEATRAAIHEPAPIGKGEPILPLVLNDLTARAIVGEYKYGTTLRANNGRDALMDAYQEACDLVMYLRQAIYERDRK